MKIFKMLLITAFSLIAATSFAAPSKAKLYAAFCGTQAELDKAAGYKVTGDELQEIIDSRGPILNVLANGQSALEELKNDESGAIGILLVCSVLNETAKQIAKKGCYDIGNDKVVYDNGGLAACAQVGN